MGRAPMGPADEPGGWTLKTKLAPQVLRGVLGLGVFALAWFALAGRTDWVQGWLVLVTFTAYVGWLSWRLARDNPDLMLERGRPGGPVESWDRVVMTIYTLGLVAQLAVSAVDSGRYGWSQVPTLVQLMGWILLVGAGWVIWHVMRINPFLSSSARLQQDRDQVVVTRGLYAHIRHPMYLSVIGAMIGLSLALGSWWSLIPGGVNVACYLYRTYREDLMLMRGLAGYSDYAQVVRSRLFPGLW